MWAIVLPAISKKEFNKIFPDGGDKLSMAQRVALLPAPERRKIFEGFDASIILNDWNFWARPSQKYPTGVWNYWLVMAGRGFGKTRVGAETVRYWSALGGERIGLIGATQADVRDVMVDGESGILSVCPDDHKPEYEKSRGRVLFKNGTICSMYSAEKADRLRGPQHSKLWGDEIAAWQRPETWDMALMGLRLGKDPRAIVTTTPRPTPLIKELMADPSTTLTTGNTFENAGNIAPNFLESILKKYEGTRLGRQEIYAEILDDNPNALWSHALIERHRVQDYPTMRRIVVGIDPAVTANKNSDETGLIVVGIADNGHVYVLADGSGVYKTTIWATHAVSLYNKWMADAIIPEVNNGGDLVEDAIRAIDTSVSIRQVRASKGKYTRAEPVAALYEQGRVHHVGIYPTLEDQMTAFDAVTDSDSPDRMDALVHAITDLVLDKPMEVRIRGI